METGEKTLLLYLINMLSEISIQLQHKNMNDRKNHYKLSCIYNMKTYHAEIQSERNAPFIGNLKSVNLVFAE